MICRIWLFPILFVLVTTEAGPSLERAHELLLAGDGAAAAHAFAELAAQPDHDGRAAEGRVRALVRQDLWAEALEEARGFQAALPDNPLVISALGETLLRAGAPEECRRLVEPLAELARPPARALMTLGRLHAAGGRAAEARRLLDLALELAPEDRDVVLRASEVAASNDEAARRLKRYLEMSDGDDPDRIQAAQETHQLLRRLGDRRTWVLKSRPDQLELPLRRLLNADGRVVGLIVQARFGASPKAKPVRLLLDTGAGGLHLAPRVARKQGVEPLGDSTLFGGGREQRHKAARGILSEVRLGELGYTDALVTVSPDEFDLQGRYHGLLGISVFDGYRITLDLKKQKLRLQRSPGDAADATDDAGALYWMFNGQMLVRVPSTEGPSGLFLFDTGAASTVLSQGFVESVPSATLRGPARVQAYGGNDTAARLAGGLQLTFGGIESRRREFTARDLTLRSRLGGIEISGFLGLDFFDKSTVVIDTSSRRVVLDPAGR